MFMPRLPNPFDDEMQRAQRVDQNLDTSRFTGIVFFGGWLVVAVFGALALVGYPGTGLVLVPIGVGMIIGGGVQLLLDRL